MTISVNGASREIADGATLADLIAALGVRREGVAIARNDDVVARGRFDDTRLVDGDAIEIISAVAGG